MAKIKKSKSKSVCYLAEKSLYDEMKLKQEMKK